MRRILTQAAQAAVKKKGCHFQNVFRRWMPSLGYKGAIFQTKRQSLWAIEQGSETKKCRAQRLAQALRKLGYTVALTPIAPAPAAG